nr:LOW QUALITY PROTEIN: protein furry-like [Lepeophtheirus salmonis]
MSDPETDDVLVPPSEERPGPEGAETDSPSAGGKSLSHLEEEGSPGVSGSSSASPTSSSLSRFTSNQILPWGAPKERPRSNLSVETDLKPGEFVMRTLFADFIIQAERKISCVLSEAPDRPISKSLQRGEDPQFDQLLSAFGSVAENTLPSLLKTLFAWYEKQGVEWLSHNDPKGGSSFSSKGKADFISGEQEFIAEKRDLAIEFIFCLLLIEVLKTLPVHPGHEDLVQYIENIAFKHFKYRDGQYLGPNAPNIEIIAELYAEVLGTLAQSRFISTKTRFFLELKELGSREPSTHTTQSIITLLMGMKFFRVKMAPFEDFELSFQFLLECAQYFLEVKEKNIKHALAGLFVEILIPVAGAVKNEVNVPCLKSFVETLFSSTLDMCTKSKHRLSIFPLVTCLLCVSHRVFFLQNWHCFLTMCLQQLKNKDTKMARVALESLYRLLWVYMIRIKCESNNVTQSRLQSIVHSLFPKGTKSIVPRDTPLNIFVKIIQFIAQEKMEFAMKDIVFDLLSVGRPIKMINAPERLNIGLRAFLVVADSLQQKEGDPPLPRTVGVMPSGSTLRVKKTFLNKMLSEDAAKSIGMSSYYSYVRKVFDDILRALDTQFGKPFLLTNTQASGNKEPEDAKPKLDLFRTVIAAIPRLIPDGMSHSDLVDTLSRLTVHSDEELRRLAWQSLLNLIVDFPDWREEVLYGFMQFVTKEVLDSQTQLLDNAVRMVLQLLTAWKTAAEKALTTQMKENVDSTISRHDHPDLSTTLHMAEGFALVMLCQCRLSLRRPSYLILKEVKLLFKVTNLSIEEMFVLDALDKFSSSVIEDKKVWPLIPFQDRSTYSALTSVDFQWLTERSSAQWTGGFGDDGAAAKSGSTQHLFTADPWSACLMGFLNPDRLPSTCQTAIFHSWPIAHSRLSQHFNVVDPAPVADNRASLLRPGTAPRKTVNEKDISMHLWKNYISFACRVVPPIPSPVLRCVSPDMMFSSIGSSSSPESLGLIDRNNDNKSPSVVSPSVMYKLLVPLLRCDVSDMRDCIVQALGRINHNALGDLMSELWSYVKEAIDRKRENMGRKRRREALRLQLVRVMELIASHGTFSRATSGVTDPNTGALAQTFTEYIEGARQILESENDKFVPCVREGKLSFGSFIRKLINSFSLERRKNLIKRDLRKSLFHLFASWSGVLGQPFDTNRSFTGSISIDEKTNTSTEFEFSALQSMISVLCCGPCFDESLFIEDGSIYTFLDLLLQSNESKIYKLAQETIVLLLEFNPNISTLLEWFVERCFTGEQRVADSCFLALATIFATREYPCDHYTAIINVTLMNTGSARTIIYETALQLLQILDHRFFGSVYSFQTGDEDESPESNEQRNTLDVLLATTYSRSQLCLSRQLSQLHPELTMPMFSEICHRLQTTRSAVTKNMLCYLLPWLYNMELVDCNFNPSDVDCPDGHTQDGWGSTEATEMITNNLFYITVKFGDDHPKEIEELWSALCACWPRNLRIIIRYLVIICGIATTELIEYAKRVLLYLGRSQPLKTIDEIMVELQTVETLNCTIERTEAPPYYRLNSLKKASTNAESNPHLANSKTDLSVEKGTIHTKRHSQEDPIRDNPKSTEISISGSLKSAGSIASTAGSVVVAGIQRVGEKVRALSGSAHQPSNLISSSPTQQPPNSSSVDRNSAQIPSNSNNVSGGGVSIHLSDEEESSPCSTSTRKNPHRPLPMPEYGGWFAPLTEFLPNASHPINSFHRCNVAVILLTDMLVDGLDCHQVDWSAHLPLMLHIIFLGLDNSRQIVQSHCQQLLLNLLIVLGDHGDHLAVSRILMNNKAEHFKYGLNLTPLPIHKFNFISKEDLLPLHEEDFLSNPEKDLSDTQKLPNSEDGSGEFSEDLKAHNPMTVREMTKSMINFIASRQKCQPFWQYEDINRTVWSISSAKQIDNFLQRVLLVFEHSLPHSLLSDRWSQLSLQLALSCSSRHYAGRSLQIFRALRVPISSKMLSDILSRLVDTIAEQGEDMQGYVTELILTLESVVDALDSNFRPMDLMKEIFKSTPNIKEAMPSRPASGGSYYHSHSRSTSFNVSMQGKSSPNQDVRCRSCTDSEGGKAGSCAKTLSRSRSAQSLRIQDQATQDDKMTILVQLFWICLAVLESDYEHEFLLGLRLLEKVMDKMPLSRHDTKEKIEKLQSQLKWTNFPGVHSLLLKGCTNSNTYEATIQILTKLTTILDFPVVDPSQSLAFPMNVIALLPYMIQNYDESNETCTFAAENIAQVSNEKNKKLENLGTVMTLYSKRSFSKKSFQWTKCVVKYLHDTYSHYLFNMLSFLIEVLEKGPPFIQAPILTIIHWFLHNMDMGSATQTINSDLLRIVAKFVETPHWNESLNILKLAVTRSSTLVAPPTSGSMSSSFHWETVSSVGSFSEADLYTKKQLPGRTMEFTFDLSQTPIIGRRQANTQSGNRSLHNFGTTKSSASSSYFASFTGSVISATSSAPGGTLSSVHMSNTKESSLRSNFSRSSILGQDSMLNLNEIGTNGGSSSSTMSPRRSLSMSVADSSSFSGWKRPWLSQARVRERLVNILNSCGQRVGLPKSPSVIFSQTSELLDRHSSMASSTEEVSANNDDKQHDTTDTEQKFGMYMKEFDFLEYELESLEGESVDNFNWGVRRPSLSHLDGDEIAPDSMNEVTPILPHRESTVRSVTEESSDDELGSVSPSIDDELLSTRSSENHSGASSSISTTSSRLYPPSSSAMDSRLGLRPLTPDSEIESDASDEELSDQDLTPCNPSPSISQLLNWSSVDENVERRQSDQQDDCKAEEVWKSHVQAIMSIDSNQSILKSFVIFARLFNELKTKTCVLSQDSSVQLSKDNSNFSKDSMKLVLTHFQTLTDILSDITKYPHVWCDLNAIGGTRLEERLKFNVLEIHENLENFIDRRDLAMECLDAVKSHRKLELLGEKLSEYNVDAEQLDLCRWLYKLYFQLLLLLESFVKLLKLVSSNYMTCSDEIPNKSSIISSMQSELLFAALNAESEPSYLKNSSEDDEKSIDNVQNSTTEDELHSPTPFLEEGLIGMINTEESSSIVNSPSETEGPNIVISVTEPEYIEQEDLVPQETSSPKSPKNTHEEEAKGVDDIKEEIIELLNRSDWISAIRLFRQNRSILTMEVEGNCISDEEDVGYLLDIYCVHLTEISDASSIYVMTIKEEDLSKKCSHWMDSSVQLLSAVKTLEKELVIIKKKSAKKQSY